MARKLKYIFTALVTVTKGICLKIGQLKGRYGVFSPFDIARHITVAQHSINNNRLEPGKRQAEAAYLVRDVMAKELARYDVALINLSHMLRRKRVAHKQPKV